MGLQSRCWVLDASTGIPLPGLPRDQLPIRTEPEMPTLSTAPAPPWLSRRLHSGLAHPKPSHMSNNVGKYAFAAERA
eukprot:scaffold1481_cov401-Prasinococcus_capsulatus_cf.AAC.1